jgi:hypothetical protein
VALLAVRLRLRHALEIGHCEPHISVTVLSFLFLSTPTIAEG